MAPVTEFAIFPVKAGVDVSDPTSDGGKILQDALDIVMAQPGAQRAYFSPEIEQPTNVRLFVDWDNVQDHINFTKSDVYQPMMKNLTPLVDGEPLIRHFAPSPFPPKPALTSDGESVTEVLHLFCPPSVSKSDQDQITSNFQELLSRAGKDCPDLLDGRGGWSLEDDIPDPTNGGEKGKVFIGLIRWTSLEAHQKFRETKTFADNIHLVREAPGKTGAAVIHVKCQERQA